ncbi:hypothetical protein, partial [Paenibacillus aquistagni]|uniref:hypothetical protein n=1 Tax=Paenibacillus aquistagni TaxID=1852522 RepID=UPI00197FBF4F
MSPRFLRDLKKHPTAQRPTPHQTQRQEQLHPAAVPRGKPTSQPALSYNEQTSESPTHRVRSDEVTQRVTSSPFAGLARALHVRGDHAE